LTIEQVATVEKELPGIASYPMPPEGGMRRLRILMITGEYYPKVDGSVIATTNLATELARMGQDVTLLTRRHGRHELQPLQGVRVIAVEQRGSSYLGRGRLAWAQVNAAMRLMKEQRFDVIHTHGFSALLAGEVLQSFYGVPVLATLHGLQRLWNKEWGVNWRLRFYLFLPFEGVMLRRARLVTAQSGLLKNAMRHYYRLESERLLVLQNPVELNQFHPTKPPTSPTVLFVGTLGRIWGPDLLIQAARIVIDRIPSARFVFVGKGPAEGDLRSLSESLGIENSVEFTGRITDRSLLESYYASSKLLAVPFRGTAGYFLGLSELEAMAVGRPIVTSQEHLDKIDGVFYTRNDPKFLAEKIIEVLNMDDQTYTRVCESVSKYAREFGTERVATTVLASYAGLTRENHAKQPQAFTSSSGWS